MYQSYDVDRTPTQCGNDFNNFANIRDSTQTKLLMNLVVLNVVATPLWLLIVINMEITSFAVDKTG